MAVGKISTWTIILGCALVVLLPVLISAQVEPVPEPSPNPTGRTIHSRNGQSADQQFTDEWDCFDWACEETGWNPYAAYDSLVAEGYAVALTNDELTEGLICLAAEGAVTGAVAGDLVGEPQKGAEWGAAIAVAMAVVREDYLIEPEDPAARRVVNAFERDLRFWERKFAACLRPKGYGVSSP